jgi:hypothetical protein
MDYEKDLNHWICLVMEAMKAHNMDISAKVHVRNFLQNLEIGFNTTSKVDFISKDIIGISLPIKDNSVFRDFTITISQKDIGIRIERKNGTIEMKRNPETAETRRLIMDFFEQEKKPGKKS